MSVFSFSYPACNAHVPRCIVIYGLPDSTAFLEAPQRNDLLNYGEERETNKMQLI